MRRLLVLITAASALVLLTNGPARAELDTFQTPSKGIACIYDDGEFEGKPFLSCEVSGYLGQLPPTPKDCDLDWEARGTLSSTGKASIGSCAGDTLMSPQARVLKYGTTWKRGPFTCTSATTGVRCKNRSGVGFLISKRVLSRI